MQPLVADIKRHSLEDGPGIRSVVFFKGCPLRCVFCHSPETRDRGVDIAFYPRRCIRCGACAEACPEEAIELDFPARIHRERCTGCGACAAVCPGQGLRRIGSSHSPEALAEILLRDLSYYHHSGGGVTLSGGECTLFPNYCRSLLAHLKGRGAHVAIQTSGYFDYAAFSEKLLPHIDLIFFDVKLADPRLHKLYTGKSNRRILHNLRSLLRQKRTRICPRIPLIPGITDTYENLSAIAELLCDFGASEVSLLPYNPMGLEMAENLGRPRPPLPERFMSPEQERAIKEMFGEILDAKSRSKRRGAQPRSR